MRWRSGAGAGTDDDAVSYFPEGGITVPAGEIFAVKKRDKSLLRLSRNRGEGEESGEKESGENVTQTLRTETTVFIRKASA